MKTKETFNLAVYGSLRQGMSNNTLLKDSLLVSITKEVLYFIMVDLGGFPGLVPSNRFHHEQLYDAFGSVPDKQEILFELYQVNAEIYKEVERLEGFPSFYQKHPFIPRVAGGEIYETYVLLEDNNYYSNNKIVKSGDWKTYYNAKIEKQYETV